MFFSGRITFITYLRGKFPSGRKPKAYYTTLFFLMFDSFAISEPSENLILVSYFPILLAQSLQYTQEIYCAGE